VIAMSTDATAAPSRVPADGRPGSRAPDVWYGDPPQLALDGSARFPVDGAPPAFCVDVGRRVLLAQLDFPGWVLRRVERVSFEEGRSVVRTMTIQLKVRPDAPVFTGAEGPDGTPRKYWLVPLALMNRRTLVEFHLSDEEGLAITMPGLRLAQRLDSSLLLAAAAAYQPLTDEIRNFVRDVIAAERREVLQALHDFAAGDLGDDLRRLRGCRLFELVLARLRYNFTLYAFLPVDQGRDRLLTMSFVEPIAWRYQRPKLDVQDGRLTYTPWQPAAKLSHLPSLMGWTPTRIRFQTPSAENAASYHFEVVTPRGVRITESTLIAGRPHAPTERVTVDHVRDDSLTIGLHAVEVPYNSLCRVQVNMRVQSAGWLTTLFFATAAIFLVMLSVAVHAVTQDAVDPGQDTNVIVLLITAAAAVATFVAQRDFPGVAARLVTGMRAVGGAAIAVPLVGAGFLAYKQVDPAVPPVLQAPGPAEQSTQVGTVFLAFVSAVLFALVTVAYARTIREERREAETSPWDLSVRSQLHEQEELPKEYGAALTRFRFRAPAVAVRSSEGWHHKYFWKAPDQRDALRRLEHLADDPPPTYSCASWRSCPHARMNGCGCAAAN